MSYGHMKQSEILAKLRADGPMGLQFIDPTEHSHGDDSEVCRVHITEELSLLQEQGLVKYTRGLPGQLDMWEAV